MDASLSLALGMALALEGGAAAPTLSFSAVTTGAETLTLQRITPTGGTCTVTWGDGSADTVIANGNTVTTTHDYAGAGTWAVTISNPELITYLDLRDSKISVSVGSFAQINRTLDTLRLENITGTFDSSDFAGSTPSSTLYFSLSSSITGTFDSSDFAGSTPSTYLRISLPSSITGTFDSSDFAGSTPSITLYFSLPSSITGTFDSSDFAGSTPSTLSIVLPNTITSTIARADWSAGILRKVASPTIQAYLTATQVDDILLGAWDDFGNRTASAGTFNIAGTNTAPSGTFQAQCSPTTGKEAANELLNDSCDVSSNHYAAIIVTGGLP